MPQIFINSVFRSCVLMSATVLCNPYVRRSGCLYFTETITSRVITVCLSASSLAVSTELGQLEPVLQKVLLH